MEFPCNTSTSFEPFDLSDPKPPKEFETRKTSIPDWSLPYIATEEAWRNYSDDLVYETDKRIREWIIKMKPNWTKQGTDRRYTFSTLLDILGINVKVRQGNNYAKIARIFAYYSTKVQKQTTINGVKRKNVYTISPARIKLVPYSLRLRIEEATHPLDGRSLMLPKDDLTVGHARHKRTEENMRRRSEEAKRRYNEYKREKREQRTSETGEFE